MIYDEVPYPVTAIEARKVRRQWLADLNRLFAEALMPVIEVVLRQANQPLSASTIDVEVTRRIKQRFGQTTQVERADVEAALQQMFAEGWVDKVSAGWGIYRQENWLLLTEHACLRVIDMTHQFDDEDGRHAVYICNYCPKWWTRYIQDPPRWRPAVGWPIASDSP